MRLISKLTRRFLKPAETLDGYDHPELIDLVFRKAQIYSPTTSWPEISGAKTVLDFGGGCGQHFKEANSSLVRWAVVETPAMAERAKELSTDRLQFFTDIRSAADWLGDIDVMHSNGAIQYTPKPEEALSKLCALRAKKMLWYRVFLGEPDIEVQVSCLGDNGPGYLPVREKLVRYERTRIAESSFHDAHIGYRLAERGEDWFHYSLI